MKKGIGLLFLFLCISFVLNAQNINPQGYYSLDSKTRVENGDTYGYFGSVTVRPVDSIHILVNLYVCKGAPSYNSGSFEDTLLYKNGVAVHTTADDASCVITFNFNTAGGVTVEEKTKDANDGCGFGHAVVASGFYKRIGEEGGHEKSRQ